jgi:hypothetical protein
MGKPLLYCHEKDEGEGKAGRTLSLLNCVKERKGEKLSALGQSRKHAGETWVEKGINSIFPLSSASFSIFCSVTARHVATQPLKTNGKKEL